MGFTPILLALLGFIFLWAIVNYNTFKRIELRMKTCYEELMQLYTQKKQTADTLYAYLQKENLSNEKIEATLSGFLEQAEEKTVLAADKDLNQWLQDCLQRAYANDKLVEGADFQALKEQIMNIQAQMMQYKKKLKASMNDYNALSQNMPSSLIASVFGFRPIELAL